IIAWLRSLQPGGQPIRDDIPESHLLKKGTPTMGGFMMLLAIVVSTLLWADLTNGYVWVALMVTLGFGAVGFVDDFLKLSRRNPKGLPGRIKLIALMAIGLVAALWFVYLTRAPLGTALTVPVFKNALIPLSYLFVPFAVFVMVGASNAVNLTDGLDGLAIGPVMIAAGCFSLIAYLAGNTVFANYLQIHHVPGVGELAVFCATLVGAGLGFLWYNAHPAQVFMGDTGSLAMGGALGAVAVATKHELVLAIIGGLFVVEALSVMIQVFWFKRTGKRIFLMAPIHHHFQKKGWHEQQIVIRFWIISVILALAGLSTLKLR
ncbi:MAG: phospho-N-acetylmuramoyl-pentapeptide-transferase, partial [Alphaproteobacteria bacterium]|nr:phospho-N-acetylmuramoyl-pentapeptide-transferase [Alphaproteobacteria bacterium]